MTSTPRNNARCWLALAAGRGRSRRSAEPAQEACVGSALRAVGRGGAWRSPQSARFQLPGERCIISQDSL